MEQCVFLQDYIGEIEYLQENSAGTELKTLKGFILKGSKTLIKQQC